MAGIASPALDADQRQALERAVGRARKLLEGDLATQAEGRFGIYATGVVDDEESLRLDPSSLSDRREIVAVIAHLHNQGESEQEAVVHLIREVAFTHLNRLVAIRIAEAIDLIRTSLADGKSSRGFRDVLELAPSLAGDDTGGYWTYLGLCGDELAGDAPVLFDPRNPLLRLAPSPAALDELIEILSDPALAGAWQAPDALGWTYQFFNSAEERRKMRDAGAPRNSRELAVRNQFFTPRYVVDFLVHNTLGRRLVESDPASPLRDELEYLVDPPDEPGAHLALEQVKVLDPACGSGHFLLGAYDVLERAWELQGVGPEESAPRILPTLWGIDIDPRCAQVASAALIMRARRHCRTAPLPRPNVMTARPLPESPEAWDRVLADLPKDRRKLLAEIKDALADAPVLGSLLKVEERLAAEIKRAVPETVAEEGTLFDAMGVVSDRFGQVEAEVLAALQRVADEASSTAADRLLAAEAGDAIRFIEAMRQRYDAVLMNPPFGEPAAGTKEMLRASFASVPSTVDLFAVFVERALGLCLEHGLMGAITSRVGLFLAGFESWRRNVLFANQLVAVADLGEGVMDQAMVEAAAYVVAAPQGAHAVSKSVFARALLESDKGRAITSMIASGNSGLEDPRLFQADVTDFTLLEGSPTVYWVGDEVLARLGEATPFEPDYGRIRVGLQTGDDFRFVRAWWEVRPERLTRDEGEAGQTFREQLRTGARWAPIVKGGASRPWFAPQPLVVNWANDGAEIKATTSARVMNEDSYFLPGLSWTLRSVRLIPYVVPAGCVPSISRYEAFPDGDPYFAIGVLASNIASSFCRFFGEKFKWPKFLVGMVKRVPMPPADDELAADLRERVRPAVTSMRRTFTGEEPFREFVRPMPDHVEPDWSMETLLGPDLDLRVAQALRLSLEQAHELNRDLEEAVRAVKGGVDREELGNGDEDFGPRGSDQERVVSYLVGCAFGRWNIRVGKDPATAPSLPDVFDPVPVCPPGMLVGEDGLPPTDAPDGYPLELPQERILLDEPGHRWDLEEAVRRAAAVLFEDPDAILREAEQILRKGPLRGYLRKQFFKDHLSRYSKSRRKAPIYWYLSVSSRAWGVWVYAPTISRESLFAVAREAARRQSVCTQTVERLQSERAGATGTVARKLDSQLDAEEGLAEELQAFRIEADRIASLGWEPDLDDGIILCAAPLADLFPAWPDAAKERANLRKGAYPWASVSALAEQL